MDEVACQRTCKSMAEKGLELKAEPELASRIANLVQTDATALSEYGCCKMAQLA